MKTRLITFLFLFSLFSFGQDALPITIELDSGKRTGNKITKTPFLINGNAIDIGIIDGNKDGKFTSNSRDGIYIEDSVSFKYRKIKEIKYLDFYGAKFKINYIDSLGKTISLSPIRTISEDSVMYFESKIRNLPFVRNDSTFDTHNYLDANKLLLIVVWSEFCAPCIEEIDELKALQTKYQDKLTILALFSGSQEDLKRRVKTHSINYSVGLMNEKIQEDIQQNGFPYKILVGEDGSILMKSGQLLFRKRLSDFVDVIENF